MLAGRKRRGQGSFEFVGILAVLMFLILGSIGFIQGRALTALKERNDVLVSSVGRVIETEILLANEVEGDYYREFELPYILGGLNYSISTGGATDVEIALSDSKQFIFLSSAVVGSFQQGRNVLRKENNVFYINV